VNPLGDARRSTSSCAGGEHRTARLRDRLCARGGIAERRALGELPDHVHQVVAPALVRAAVLLDRFLPMVRVPTRNRRAGTVCVSRAAWSLTELLVERIFCAPFFAAKEGQP